MTASYKRKRQRGNAMIELSLLAPVLVSLFLGSWCFGYSNYMYAELEQAVRSGARYASHGVYQPSNASAFRDAVKNAAVYGDPTGGSTPNVRNLTTSMVNVSVSPTTGTPTAVTVSISGYDIWGPFGKRFSLGNKPSLTVPFMGYYVPL